MRFLRSLTLGSLALAAPLLAQNLTHIRLASEEAPALAQRFESEGHDVVEGSVTAGSLELVVTDEELRALEREGYALQVLLVGRPFHDIQAAQGQGQGPDAPGTYPDLAGVLASMQATAAAFPGIAQLVNVTSTYGQPLTAGNRSVFALKISDNVAVDEDEPAFLMVSCHHAREIVTPIIALDTIDRLTSNYGSDPQITALVDENEIWIAPVWNPDGYNFVFTNNCLWRKNRRNNGGGSFGVDLNRNYPFGWNSGCGGSTNPASDTYRGPSAASEPETQAMLALSNDVRFAKVIDFHSSGREVLRAYRCSPAHPLATFLQNEAVILSNMSGYGGATRVPSAEGEHYEWQLATFGSHAFLTETATTFQPSLASAQAEANLVWPGTVWMLERAIVFSGHVTDSGTGNPLVADIDISGVNFQNGEQYQSGGPFGRYDLFLPNGSYTATFSAPGYISQNVAVNVVGGIGPAVDVALDPVVPVQATVTFRNGTGINPACQTSLTTPVIGNNWIWQVDLTPFPGVAFTISQGRAAPDPGIVLGFGEVLFSLVAPVFFSIEGIPSAGQVTTGVTVPNDTSIIGLTVTLQTAAFGGGMIQGICNAEDGVVGTF